MGNGWKRIVDRARTIITNVTNGVGLFIEDQGSARRVALERGKRGILRERAVGGRKKQPRGGHG